MAIRLTPQTADLLEQAHEKAGNWVRDAFLPRWSCEGLDPRGGFRERLALDGSAIQDHDTRIRVQARQTFVFAAAFKLGWQEADPFIARGVRTLIREGQLETGLFAMRLVPGAGPVPGDIDLYDLAFALFALARAYEVLEDAEVKQAAEKLVQALDDYMRRPRAEGGYKETLPEKEVREQNPHMHLLEAFLAAYEAFGDIACLEKACDVARFSKACFYGETEDGIHELAGVLRGDEPDSAGRVRPREDRLEPGHQFEWSWLLSELARHLTGAGRLAEGDVFEALSVRLMEIGRLFRAEDGRLALSHEIGAHEIGAHEIGAYEIGVPSSYGVSAGPVRQAIWRSWVQTEALRAYVADALREGQSAEGAEQAAQEAVRALEILFEDHLKPNGVWMDQIDFDRTPQAEFAPASSGYHIMGAFLELDKLARAAGLPQALDRASVSVVAD